MPSNQTRQLHAESLSSRRRCGRVRQRSFRCNLGDILDISAAGMRVRCMFAPGAARVLPIHLKGFDLPGPLLGQRVWRKRLGWFQQEIGIEFIDTDPDVVQCLTKLAGCGGIPRIQPTPIAQAA